MRSDRFSSSSSALPISRGGLKRLLSSRRAPKAASSRAPARASRSTPLTCAAKMEASGVPAEWFLDPKEREHGGGALGALRRSLGGSHAAGDSSPPDPVLGSSVTLFAAQDPHVVRLATTTRLRDETYDVMFAKGVEEIARAEKFVAEVSAGRKLGAGGGTAAGADAASAGGAGGADIVSDRGDKGSLDPNGRKKTAWAPPPPPTPLALSGTQGVGAYELFGRSADGRPVPRLRALETPVRAVVLPISDPLAVGALASVAGSLAEVVPPLRLWLQDPARYHATLFHASTKESPRTLRGEGGVDREATQIAVAISQRRAGGKRALAEGGGAAQAGVLVNPDEEALLRLYEGAAERSQLKLGETQTDARDGGGTRAAAAANAAANAVGEGGAGEGGAAASARSAVRSLATTVLPPSDLPFLACPPTLVLDRVVVAPGGAVVACWQVADGSDPRELRAALRRALPDAPPEQVVSNPDILHTTVARYIPPDMPDSLSDRSRRVALRAQADDLRALAEAAERATKALCGTPFTAEKLWHVEEHDHLALALRGRYAIREVPLQRCTNEEQ